MGCTASVLNENSPHATVPVVKSLPRETRIIQEEVVDVYINDEYDVVSNDWEGWSEDFQPENFQYLEITGSWEKGMSAGGSRNDLESFSTNPQYLLVLGPIEHHPKNDEFYLPCRKYGRVEVAFCLTQTDFDKPPLHVAFFVYKSDRRDERLGAEYFLCMPPEIDTGTFVNWRQVQQHISLTPGLYIVIPAVFRSGIEGTFKLAIKAPPPVNIQQMPVFKSLSRNSSIQTNINSLHNSEVNT